MSYNNPNWKPHEKNKIILDKAMSHIQSVNYKVSSRWVFYRLLQEGLYHSKKDYNTFIQIISRSRHFFYQEKWHPAILADETREAIVHSRGRRIEDIDLREEIESASMISILLSHFYDQDYYVELLFEARAMTQQFEYYTDRITLVSFGGHPSIPFKWEIAKRLEECHYNYKKPVVILYFGDLDDDGTKIYNSAIEDINIWCDADIEFVRCGLTEEQVERYNVPENFEKPGDYQWEALSDEAAREIIQESVNKYISQDVIYKTRKKETEIEELVSGKIEEAIANIDLSDLD